MSGWSASNAAARWATTPTMTRPGARAGRHCAANPPSPAGQPAPANCETSDRSPTGDSTRGARWASWVGRPRATSAAKVASAAAAADPGSASARCGPRLDRTPVGRPRVSASATRCRAVELCHHSQPIAATRFRSNRAGQYSSRVPGARLPRQCRRLRSEELDSASCAQRCASTRTGI